MQLVQQRRYATVAWRDKLVLPKQEWQLEHHRFRLAKQKRFDIISDFIPLFTAANYFNMTVSNKKALATLDTVHK